MSTMGEDWLEALKGDLTAPGFLAVSRSARREEKGKGALVGGEGKLTFELTLFVGGFL